MLACQFKHLDVVNLLLEQSATDINLKAKYEVTFPFLKIFHFSFYQEVFFHFNLFLLSFLLAKANHIVL